MLHQCFRDGTIVCTLFHILTLCRGSNMQQESIGETVERLHRLTERPNSLAIRARIALCSECIAGVFEQAEDWAKSAAIAKGLTADSALRAEDMLSGPVVVARQLQLTIQTLSALQTAKTPTLPGQVYRLSSQQLCVPVFPTNGYFDSLTFMGLRGTVRMQEGIGPAEIHGDLPERVTEGRISGISAVLGAGNVSSIPVTDSLNRIMFEGRRVILKMNPVNEYLAPIFEKAFAPLIRENLLVIVTGAANVGGELINHRQIDDVHITGSAATHDNIVWGSDPEQARQRKLDNSPLLAKPVTSELGNVTPWIMVPGNYSLRQLQSQAQHVAASITNNASFNCLATKVIVTWNRWQQREQFLSLVQHFLNQTPIRPAYYPGAADRFRRFTGTETSPDDNNCLPWTLLQDQRYDERQELFCEESFVCVCAETQLDGNSPTDFLQLATEFANEQMTGTLCASVTFPDAFRRQNQQAAELALQQLRYGSVCVNQWSGLAYGLISPPWGAYPGATLQNVQSGIGNVHNTYLLHGIEKAILEGPLINFPKPIWFPTHRNGLSVARQLLSLYHRPSLLRLPKLFASALMG